MRHLRLGIEGWLVGLDDNFFFRPHLHTLIQCVTLTVGGGLQLNDLLRQHLSAHSCILTYNIVIASWTLFLLHPNIHTIEKIVFLAPRRRIVTQSLLMIRNLIARAHRASLLLICIFILVDGSGIMKVGLMVKQ